MDFQFTEEQEEIRKQVHALCSRFPDGTNPTASRKGDGGGGISPVAGAGCLPALCRNRRQTLSSCRIFAVLARMSRVAAASCFRSMP